MYKRSSAASPASAPAESTRARSRQSAASPPCYGYTAHSLDYVSQSPPNWWDMSVSRPGRSLPATESRRYSILSQSEGLSQGVCA